MIAFSGAYGQQRLRPGRVVLFSFIVIHFRFAPRLPRPANAQANARRVGRKANLVSRLCHRPSRSNARVALCRTSSSWSLRPVIVRLVPGNVPAHQRGRKPDNNFNAQRTSKAPLTGPGLVQPMIRGRPARGNSGSYSRMQRYLEVLLR